MTASGMHWVGTWATAPAPAEGGAFSNQTLRMNARISIGGDTLRLRLSNAYGVRPLTIGSAHVGLRTTGPGIVPGVGSLTHIRRRDLRHYRCRRTAAE